MKKRNTKRALLTSVLSLLLCCSMLIGTTFAWFTDKVTSGVNQIIAGNLDVEVYNSLTVGDKKVSSDTKLFDEITYWEPGVVAYENLTVANLGTLALKYELSVNFDKATTNANRETLAKVLKVGFVEGGIQSTTREGALTEVDAWLPLKSFVQSGKLDSVKQDLTEAKTSDSYGIVIWWEPSNIDNEFNMNNENQGKIMSIELGIKLVATQLTAESDSFGSDYDKDANYPAINTELAEGGDTITAGEVAVKLPAGAEEAMYTVNVDNKVVTTDATGDTTVSFNIELLKDGVKVEPQAGVTYPVSIYVGKNLNITEVTHKGTAVANWTYDSVEGVVSFETDSFSPFAVSYFSGMVEAAADIEALIAKGADLIVLDKNIESVDGIVITDKKLTIDLNGKTFTVSEGASTNNRNFKINGASEVTIKNGTMVAAGELTSGAYGTIRTEGTAKVTLDNVKLYNYRGNGLNIKACSGTTVIVNNTEIYSQYGGGVEAAGGTVELNNVKVEQKGMWTAPYNSMAISVNGGGKVTVNSGTYTTECLTAEEAYNQGTSHGPWTIGVLNSGGTLIVNGGTFSNDNFGDNGLATYARGLVLADTGAVIEINGGEFNAVKAIIDVTNNLGDTSRQPSATLAGGTFSADPTISGLYASNLIKVAEGYEVALKDDGTYVVKDGPVAMVGNTNYYSIEEALAAWTNNTTLTLKKDVTLPDVVRLKSTEHHILNLGKYTMTAASGKNAFEIIAYGTGDAERTAITIKADATNPGTLDAGKKSVVYYDYSKGVATGNDRPIIKIEGGNFVGATSSFGAAGIYFKGVEGESRKAATLNISGGNFNCSINGQIKSKLLISGGTFHYSVGSQGDSTALRLISGGTFKTLGFMTADSKNTKFWFGTSMGNSNVGLYIDENNYLVVGGPVITGFGDQFEAKATNATKWSSYLQYSSAAANGLYYVDADMAVAKHGEANVVLPE